MSVETLREWMDEIRKSPEYKVAVTKGDVSEQIWALMKAKELSCAQLANAMDVSPSYAHKILVGDQNLTIESLVKIASALGQEVSIQFVSRKKERDAA